MEAYIDPVVSVQNTDWDVHLSDVFDDAQYLYEQFIGRTDKNGKEIYEGDLLGAEGSALEVYRTDNGYLLRSRNDKSETSSLPVWALADQFNQIIGNIHENPELLK